MIKNFLIKVIEYFFFRNYGYKNYPLKFSSIPPIKKKYKKYKNNFKKKNINKNVYTLDLSSKKIIVNSSNIWKKKTFKDEEDLSQLHRWSWAIKLVSESKKYNYQFINKKIFLQNSFLSWISKNFLKNIDKNDVLFHPYNISERICNYIILVKLKIIKPNLFVLSRLEDECFYLLKNIEYFKFKKSNHALNNLRALYIFSIYSKNKQLENYSISFICHLMNDYVDDSGFYKFCSSNYQFIFTKWLSDVLMFSNGKKGQKINFLKNIYKKNISTLYFFLQRNNYKLSIPLIGNISPDFKNEWLINFFLKKNSNYFFKKYWNNFRFKRITNNNHSISIMKNKEWLKINNSKITVYVRNPIINGFDFNHSHNDFFNFVTFLNGKQYIIDRGRKNYLKKYNSLKLSKTHNSFTINNQGIFDQYLKENIYYKLKNLKTEVNYKIKKINNKYILMHSINKNFSILRKIELEKNYLIVEDKFNSKQKVKLEIKFNFDLNLKNYKINNITDEKYLKKIFKLKKYTDYGKEEKINAINYSFFTNNLKFKTIFKVS